jgi:hypothetical protein
VIPQATLVAVRNPMRETEREIHVFDTSKYPTVFDWSSEHLPHIQKGCLLVTIDGKVATPDDSTIGADVIVVRVIPGVPVLGAIAYTLIYQVGIATIIANTLVSLAVNAIIGALFKPKTPSSLPTPSPTYSFGAGQNQYRVGASIPIVYGQVVMTPDYASQAYVRYENNDQYIRMIFCLGRGTMTVDKFLIANTEYAMSGGSYSDENVQVEVFPPSRHNSQFYTIQIATGINENAYSSGEVGDQELLAPNQIPAGATTNLIGPFSTCKPGQSGTRIEIDLVAPGGLYFLNNSGNIQALTLDFEFTFQPIDDNGSPSAGPIINNWSLTRGTNTPVRETVSYIVPSGRYKVSVRRTNNGATGSSRIQDKVSWTALKFFLDPPVGPVYGDVTLVAMRIKATNGINGNAAQQIKFRAQRLLTAQTNSGPQFIATSNPVDAFVDVLSANYGGNRPYTDIDFDRDTILAARNKFESVTYNGEKLRFDGVFDQQSTVWEALQISLQVGAMAPLPLGGQMSIVHDCVKPNRVAMFTDENIVAGSLSIGYDFDKLGEPTGVKVEYRDPVTFQPAFVTLPAGSLDNQNITLFGCTQQWVAQQHAQLVLNRRARRRKTARFDTELEGLLVRHGDRIAISHTMPRWAQSAQIVEVNGLVLTLSKPLDWTGTGPFKILLRGDNGTVVEVIGVTRGSDDFEMILPGLPSVTIRTREDDMEASIIAFGSTDKYVTDWVVTSMDHKGDTVGIECTVYDPGVYDGTLPHQLVP